VKESGESFDMKQREGTNRSQVSAEDRKIALKRNKILTSIGHANSTYNIQKLFGRRTRNGYEWKD